jgi:hypothetical protein
MSNRDSHRAGRTSTDHEFEEITPHFVARGRWLDRVRCGAFRFGSYNDQERHRKQR